MTNKFENEQKMNAGRTPYFELQCPLCNSTHLHHEVVNIFQRKEDKETTYISANTNDNTIFIIPSYNKNISARRGGVEIIFSCEECHKDSSLHVIQHKGTTYMGWQNTKKELKK